MVQGHLEAFVGEASLFFIGMHIIKTKGKRLVQNIYAWNLLLYLMLHYVKVIVITSYKN
jgi:hypothetical protein